MRLHAVCLVALALVFFAPAVSRAQDAPAQAPKESNAPADGSTESADTDASTSTVTIEGDVITLTNGKQLRGGRVIRETPSSVEVETFPGQPPLKIPRRQVVSVERAGAAAVKPAPSAAGTSSNASDVMLGEELSADFHRKITTPVPETPVAYEDRDLIEVLEDLAQRMQCAAVFEAPVNELPVAQRKITVTVPAGATLAAFFRKEYKEAAPAVKVSYQYDKINVSLAEEPAPKQPWEEAGPAN